jgi:cytochrome c-type biogenesis protein CcmH/NrfF
MWRPWTKRAAQLIFVAVFAAVVLGASDPSARFYKDSHSMMCVCSCNQLLGECNHVGCPDSDNMRKELSAMIAKGDSDNTIFRAFAQKYGPVALAAPMFTPFNRLAWIMPPLVFFLGIGAVLLVVRKWKLHTVPVPHAPAPGESQIRDRIRRETRL